MTLLTEDEARRVMDRALASVTADEATIHLQGGVEGNLRFACNTPTTSGLTSDVKLHITCAFGKQVGSFWTSDLGDEALVSAVRRAEEIARLSPASPEYVECLPPQEYLSSPCWDEETACRSPDTRAAIAAGSILTAQAGGITAAGYYVNKTEFEALANTSGLFAFHQSTRATYSLTARTNEGIGSGWAGSLSHRAADVDGRRVTETAIKKALASRDPIEIEPGVYPTVLEPSTVAEMVGTYLWSQDRREADEGRNFFSVPGGLKLGLPVFDKNVTLYSDPSHPVVPVRPWNNEGLPLARTYWIEKGVPTNLVTSRYWAKEKQLAPIAYPGNVIMEGDEHTIDDLIASTEYGLLATSFWYIREVDPKTMLQTGLTRDGLFLIEKGKITRPVVNFRWNESPAALLGCIEMMSRPEPTLDRDAYIRALLPALKVREFHYTSVSPSS